MRCIKDEGEKYVQGRIIRRLHKLGAHNHISLGVGVKVLNVAEDLRRRLASAENSHANRSGLVAEELGNHAGVLARVDNTGVVLGKRLGDGSLAAESKQDVASLVGGDVASNNVARSNSEELVRSRGLNGLNSNDLRLIFYHIIEMTRAPAEVVLELDSRRGEGAEVDKINQALILVKVVEEGEVGAGIAQRGKVLDEGDLHLGSGKEHAGVPGKVSLLLEKEDLGRLGKLAGLDGVVRSNGDRNAGGAEANADEVVDLIRRGGPQVTALGEVLVLAGGGSRAVAHAIDHGLRGVGAGRDGGGVIHDVAAVRRHCSSSDLLSPGV